MKLEDCQFTVFSYKTEYLKYMFKDLFKLSNFSYVTDPYEFYCKGILSKYLYKIHSNHYFNHIISLPYKTVWNKILYTNIRNPEKKQVFIFLMRWLKPQNEFLFSLLKSRIPGCTIIIYFEDLVETGKGSLDYDILKKYADIVISYDKNDALKYGFHYYPTFMSNLNSDLEHIRVKYDVCFYGADKNRGRLIEQAYILLKNRGYKCDFGIYKPVSPCKAKGIKQLRWLISYKRYLKHVQQSQYILEIMQDGAVGFTLRCWEAILLNKKLLTNNQNILNAPFFNRNQFGYFEDISELPDLMEKMSYPHSQNDYLKNLEPVGFLNMITSLLK